ncbi:hypothetical protein EV192_120102 [Actinocrispum wychmicini]|uniref:Alkylhydroperoxidase family enzyme n=1 Tax=Actinocrispum wychmicini TaxID=1213861 RepID=A0A4R2INH9_9PSEU|nr:hypothetical protein EV192_120102 [Actinocrispum wychmicini]
MRSATADADLDGCTRAILVAACASAFGDAYCWLAWGSRLADATDDRVAAALLRGDDEALTPSERTLAAWVRQLARDPNRTTADDVQTMRDTGLSDSQIFAVTVFVALRLAFSTINDAIGVLPDAALRTTAPEAVRVEPNTVDLGNREHE